MKATLLLIASEKSDESAIVADAATRMGRHCIQVANCRRAFELFSSDLNHVDVVVIDLDPGVHGISILEAVASCKKKPPVIAITGLEELDMEPLAIRHGAAACLGKPFNASQLTSLIEEICQPPMSQAVSCDLWGHPCEKHGRFRGLNLTSMLQ